MMPRPDELLLALDAPSAGGGLPVNGLMIVAMFAIMYFIVFRPQQKEAKELAQLIASLQKGDRVVTASGIHGRIHEAKGDTLVLELSPNAYMTIDREAVKRKVDPNKPADAKPDAKKGT